MSNVDDLVNAHLIKKEELSAKHEEIINEELTPAEVRALISVREKFGRGSMKYGNDAADVF